jgi:hypothetical protein
VVEELHKRGVPILTMSTEEFLSVKNLTKDDLVVGNFDWTRHATKQLGIQLTANDYPECLSHLLHRKIWRSTLIDV